MNCKQEDLKTSCGVKCALFRRHDEGLTWGLTFGHFDMLTGRKEASRRHYQLSAGLALQEHENDKHCVAQKGLTVQYAGLCRASEGEILPETTRF